MVLHGEQTIPHHEVCIDRSIKCFLLHFEKKTYVPTSTKLFHEIIVRLIVANFGKGLFTEIAQNLVMTFICMVRCKSNGLI